MELKIRDIEGIKTKEIIIIIIKERGSLTGRDQLQKRKEEREKREGRRRRRRRRKERRRRRENQGENQGEKLPNNQRRKKRKEARFKSLLQRLFSGDSNSSFILKPFHVLKMANIESRGEEFA